MEMRLAGLGEFGWIAVIYPSVFIRPGWPFNRMKINLSEVDLISPGKNKTNIN